MNYFRKIPRDRKTPGLACGSVWFALKWPSGSDSSWDYCRKNLDPIIRGFKQSLRHVPFKEQKFATANMKIGLRKPRGGVAYVQLASWVGTEPVEAFLQRARNAWRQVHKENAEHRRVMVSEVFSS